MILFKAMDSLVSLHKVEGPRRHLFQSPTQTTPTNLKSKWRQKSSLSLIFIYAGTYCCCVEAYPKAIMAEAKTLKIARLVALAHIVVGILLLIFGIVDRVEGYFWTGEGCFGIWCGIWVRLLSLNNIV